MAEWPSELPGYLQLPAYHALVLPALEEPPPGIMIHSGDEGEGTAEWAWNQAARFFAHFAWSTTHRQYVQTCSLRLRAPHAGAYNGWIGIEMPGPWHRNPRPPEQRKAVRALVRELHAALPSTQLLTGHRWVERKKMDPGPGVEASWWDGLGLEVHWRWVGRELLVPS